MIHIVFGNTRIQRLTTSSKTHVAVVIEAEIESHWVKKSSWVHQLVGQQHNYWCGLWLAHLAHAMS
jgi:pyruvate/2-oxoacid:ferredoxin oxidoreductase beta subunit